MQSTELSSNYCNMQAKAESNYCNMQPKAEYKLPSGIIPNACDLLILTTKSICLPLPYTQT